MGDSELYVKRTQEESPLVLSIIKCFENNKIPFFDYGYTADTTHP